MWHPLRRHGQRSRASRRTSDVECLSSLLHNVSAQRPAQPGRCSGLFACASFGEHLLQPSKDRRNRLRCQPPEGAEKALGVDRAELVQSDEAGSALKATRHSPRVCPPARGHRRDDHSAQVLVQLVRGHYETRAGLLNLAAKRGIQPNEVDFAAGPSGPRYFHSHSSRSKRVAVGSSSRASCPRSRMARAAFAQPVRGRRVAWMTSRPGSACNSTSSGSCACSRRTFGTRIPRELPILTMRVLVVMCLHCSHGCPDPQAAL